MLLSSLGTFASGSSGLSVGPWESILDAVRLVPVCSIVDGLILLLDELAAASSSSLSSLVFASYWLAARAACLLLAVRASILCFHLFVTRFTSFFFFSF